MPPVVDGPTLRLFHLVDPQEWADATATGAYRPASLVAEGFVHLSFGVQVAGTANRHYAHAPALIAVEFHAASLSGELRVEDSYGRGTAFPHLYAALAPSAAVAVHPLERGSDGQWQVSPDVADAAASTDR